MEAEANPEEGLLIYDKEAVAKKLKSFIRDGIE
jgi:hypothetical protein